MLSKIWAPNGPNICGIYGKSVDYGVALVPVGVPPNPNGFPGT